MSNWEKFWLALVGIFAGWQIGDLIEWVFDHV